MTTTTLTPDSVETFRQRLRGPLLSPQDAGLEEATLLWNGVISKTPTIVIQPTGTADVVAAVDFARERGLALSVRGGGHNIAGTALADGGLTIGMPQLRGSNRSRPATPISTSRPQTRIPRASEPRTESTTTASSKSRRSTTRAIYFAQIGI